MVRVFFLPGLVDPADLAGRRVVVIDVLRATTTIVWALANGAREVVPFEEVAEARRMAAESGGGALLGGERQGKKIAGFDLGNSPAEYTAERVSGKSIFFTTTNGTRAMQACREASTIWMGAFANLDALCEQLAQSPDWDVVCAGTDGQVTREDVLLAGALVSQVVMGGKNEEKSEKSEEEEKSEDIRRMEVPTPTLNDQALMAAELWRSAEGPSRLTTTRLTQLLHHTHGGRNLLEIGQGEDIARAAQMNKFPLIAELNPQSGKIHRL
jgi:2-phosphosulfolactate phosphatase